MTHEQKFFVGRVALTLGVLIALGIATQVLADIKPVRIDVVLTSATWPVAASLALAIYGPRGSKIRRIFHRYFFW